jgi:hypothetical protein
MTHRPAAIACAALLSLTGCTLAPLTKVPPGSNFSTTCFTQRFGDTSACDSQAKEKCDSGPVSTESTSQQQGKNYTYSVFYRCP